MEHDDKAARPRAAARAGAGVVRSTAPAGTPFPVAPHDPPPHDNKAFPTDQPPRTVGGHTARLVVPESHAADEIDIDTESPKPEAPVKEAAPAEPPSRTIGGTMRLAPVPTDTAEAAQIANADLANAENGVQNDVEPHAAPARVSPSGSTFAARLFAPMSVAVGLIFFAMGSIVELVIDGRIVGASSRAPAAAVSAGMPETAEPHEAPENAAHRQPAAASPPTSEPAAPATSRPAVPAAETSAPAPPAQPAGPTSTAASRTQPPSKRTQSAAKGGRPPLPF